MIQTAFLGDLILSIPLFKQIKSRYPHGQLILVCKAGLGDYFLKEKIVDQVFEIKKNDRGSYQKIIDSLNQLNVDHLFCVHRSVRSQLFSYQIKAKNKIAFKSFLGRFIFNDLIEFKTSWPEALRQLYILSSTNAKIASALNQQDWSYLNRPDASGHLPPIPATLQASDLGQVNNGSSKKIAIFPGSVWATKKWTEDGFAKTANYFSEHGYQVFLMGGPDEKDICLRIQMQSPQCQVLAGSLSIADSVHFIKTCALVVANDSAPTHMAACQDIPVVSIFGPTVLRMGFRPWSSKAIIVENNNLDCRPCGKHGHQKCPLGHHHCMKQIAASTVIDAGLQLINSNNLSH
ncbi:MAG: glycosyltransferase family 9 protein [Bdellovibrio sp.]|nr:glycosyltransferase family 9 protein [Bdellovibrio sp.]